MEAIDKFKYQILLVELESLKGLKKPVQDFIRKIHKLSNGLSFYAKGHKEQPLTMMYSFALINRAIIYDKSTNTIKKSILYDVANAANELLRRCPITADNIVEITEYYTGGIVFTPRDIKELLHHMESIERISPDKLYFKSFHIREFKSFSDIDTPISIFIKQINSNSVLLSKLETNPKPEHKQQLSSEVDDLQRVINLINLTLKDTE